VTTLLEEMPVRETVEGLEALSAAGIAVGPVVANQVVRPRLDASQAAALAAMGPEGLQQRAEAAGAAMSGRTAELTVDLAATHRARVELQTGLRTYLDERTDHGVLCLPQLTGATFDVRDIEILADALALQVGEPGPRAEELLRGIADPAEATTGGAA
jgi:hypothetical protein